MPYIDLSPIEPTSVCVRYVVLKRPGAQRRPGTPTPIYEPEIVATPVSMPLAIITLGGVLHALQSQGYTLDQPYNKCLEPNRWDAFKQTPTGEWDLLEVSIAECKVWLQK